MYIYIYASIYIYIYIYREREREICRLWRQPHIVAWRAGRSKLGTQRSIHVGRTSATYLLTVLVGCCDGRSVCQDI